MNPGTSVEAFFALLKAGLWENSVRLSPFEPIDFEAIFQLADDQSVVGLVAAGLEQVEDRKIVKAEALPFLKKVFSLEQRNEGMNEFIAGLVAKMHGAGIETLLVKGQGIAQCYARPKWRSAGDVDLFLDEENYEKAKAFLTPSATSVEIEGESVKHLGMTLDSWSVELHGTLRCELSRKMDKVIDEIQKYTFEKRQVRVWQNGETEVFLPAVDNDVIFVFTHFLKHFYKGGLGLRQICDWCRLLWTYRESLDVELLERRLRKMGLLSEWKAFAAYVVEYLGMPPESMPLYSSAQSWIRKAGRIHRFILEVGNFGHNRQTSSDKRHSYLVRKAVSFGQRVGDSCRHALIFPLDSLRFLPNIVYYGMKSAVRGE